MGRDPASTPQDAFEAPLTEHERAYLSEGAAVENWRRRWNTFLVRLICVGSLAGFTALVVASGEPADYVGLVILAAFCAPLTYFRFWPPIGPGPDYGAVVAGGVREWRVHAHPAGRRSVSAIWGRGGYESRAYAPSYWLPALADQAGAARIRVAVPKRHLWFGKSQIDSILDAYGEDFRADLSGADLREALESGAQEKAGVDLTDILLDGGLEILAIEGGPSIEFERVNGVREAPPIADALKVVVLLAGAMSLILFLIMALGGGDAPTPWQWIAASFAFLALFCVSGAVLAAQLWRRRAFAARAARLYAEADRS